MKNILVVYYTQTGQLKDIIDNFLKPFSNENDYNITFEYIRPVNEFNYPWKIMDFFDSFAESVNNIPCEIEPLKFNSDLKYDLIIIAYQIWYLNPSIPAISALKNEKLLKSFKDTPVVTVIGSRNMWILAQEKVKQIIYNAGGSLKGNIVLRDKSSNLVGIITIVYWLIFGKKGRFLWFFPKPGVSLDDIKNSSVFGDVILDCLRTNDFSQLQSRLIEKDCVKVSPGLLIFEKRISRIFRIWANFILKSGNAGDIKRRPKLYFFIVYLILAILILAPISTIISAIYLLFRKKSTKKEIAYYSNVLLNFEKNN